MSNLANKQFRDNNTGNIIKIVDSYENIAITDAKEKIDARRLLDNRYFTEYIDPNAFFNSQSTYNVFAEQVKGVDLNKIPEDSGVGSRVVDVIENINTGVRPTTNESAVVAYNEADEIEELKRRYGAVNATVVDEDSLVRQNEAFSKILGDEAPPKPVHVQPKPKAQDVYVEPNQTYQQTISDPIERIEAKDPIITMFKGVKRNVKFNVNLKIENKIPRLDFIEMLEDSYDTSIIEYLAEEFTRNLLSDPEKIREKFISEIKSLLPKKEEDLQVKQPAKKTPARKKAATKKPEPQPSTFNQENDK